MRFLVVASCVAAVTTAPALACPRAMMCFVAPDRTAGTEVVHAAKRPAQIPNLRKANVHMKPRAHLTFDAPPKPDPSEVEMPWIWRVVRDKFHDNVPTHRSQGLVLRMAPVVVTMPTETVPGLGVAGDF